MVFMTADHYQTQAIETRLPEADDLRYLTLGLVGEAGEVANIVKKVYRNYEGVTPDYMRDRILEEIGDVLWYAANLCELLTAGLGDVMQDNLDKLAARRDSGTLKEHG